MKPRDLYMNKLIQWIDKDVIKIISGVRRSGKSNLLMLLSKELKSRGVDESRIKYINFELIEFDHLRDYKSLNKYVMDIVKNEGRRIYLLIDEVQNCSSWERVAASLLASVDCDIYLTGSNAGLLSGELATYLAGRYVEINVYPLSFKEYLQFDDVDITKPFDKELKFYKYLKYGGFPGLYMLPDNDEVKRQYLDGIADSVVLKDVIQRNQIREPELLDRVLLYIMDNVGQIFSAKNIVDYQKSIGSKVSVDSVYSYISALENAMVIHAAKRYDVKGKKVMSRMEKYFICDTGLRYTKIGYRDDDVSQLLENVIYMHLKAGGYDVHVGKEGEREIDFIAEKNNNRIYIQVSYLLATDEVVEREYKPLQMIKDSYPKWVLSMDKLPIGQRDGIRWMNLIDFLLK